jgi:hypothetical protein
MLGGLGLAILSLWQVGRLLREAERAPARLDALVDELVATAEATTATVVDRAEALTTLLAAADERIAALRGEAGRPASPVEPEGQVVVSRTRVAVTTVQPPSGGLGDRQRPQTQPSASSLATVVSARAAAGQDEATIARELGLARTAVRLALQAAQSGGER